MTQELIDYQIPTISPERLGEFDKEELDAMSAREFFDCLSMISYVYLIFERKNGLHLQKSGFHQEFCFRCDSP